MIQHDNGLASLTVTPIALIQTEDEYSAAYLFENVIKKAHVCLLGFNGVGEECVRLIGVHLLLRWSLHPNDEGRLRDILLDNGPSSLIVLQEPDHR